VSKLSATRIRDAEKTRADILKAARSLFTTRGYTQAGVRDIAAKVGVDAALVTRYFGSKKELFRAALESEPSAADWFHIPKSRFGECFVSYLFAKPLAEADALAMLLRAAGDGEVREIASSVVETRFIQPLVQWLGPPSAQARATLFFSLLSGVWTYRRLVPLTAFAPRGAAPDALVQLGAILQRLVDGRAPRSRRPKSTSVDKGIARRYKSSTVDL
jgi:AcrR family transcriptional regulator